MSAALDQNLSPAILWFRADLRLTDNHALAHLVESGRPIVAVYIKSDDPQNARPRGAAQNWWLHHSLTALDQDISLLGGTLILRRGDPGEVLKQLVEETGATEVAWNRRYEPISMAADATLKTELGSNGVHVRSFAGHLLHEPTHLKTGTGGPYRVYTPFWRALTGSLSPQSVKARPEYVNWKQQQPRSERLSDWALLPDQPNWAEGFSPEWTPGEKGAQARLAHFLEQSVLYYKTDRDRPDRTGTSGLSPHLALGEISPNQIWQSTEFLGSISAEPDVMTFRKELVWREFAYHLLVNFPQLPIENYNAKFAQFPWQQSDAELCAWKNGQTGYPIVDAGMRQLWQTGWMHNRVRMIVASFLCKHLLIHWKAGETWFWDTLLDADLASNSASWQWVAGSGADAAPYFRIFNPITQGERFDPNGDYVRRFVPELSGLPAKYIHAPWTVPSLELKAAGIVLGQTYPNPIVDHKTSRDRALAAYQDMKDAA